ncbi:MAG: hypothetical protein QXS19_09580 [Candidatus Methanomethylicia archaeon]
MPVREPGVIVYISGQDLPPPLPPTTMGIGAYIDAKNGPYKLRFTTIRDYTDTYTDPNPVLNSELAFLFPVTSINTMMLPGLHLKRASGYICLKFDSSSTPSPYFSNFLSYLQSTTRNREEVFYLPSWLDGLPRFIGFIPSVTLPNTTPVNLNDLRLTGARMSYSGNQYGFLSQYSDSTTVADFNSIGVTTPSNWYDWFDIIRFVMHKSGYDFIVWFYDANNSANVVLYFRYNATVANDLDYTVFIYSDTSDIFGGNLSIDLYLQDISTSTNYTLNWILNIPTFTSLAYVERGVNYDIVYITPDKSDTIVNVSSSISGDVLTINTTIAGNPVTFTYNNFSYSPLETGYYGFIKNTSIEMFVDGDIYSTTLNTTLTSYVFTFNSPATRTTNFYFTDPRHIGMLPKSFASLPSSPYAGIVTVGTDVYKYVYNWIYDVDGDIIKPYNSYMKYHSSLIYYEDDIIPLWETPATIDIVFDYSGKLNYSFTRFIRDKHSKLMFKICGLPDVSFVPLADRYANFAIPYWRDVIGSFGGFHYYRINNSSLRGVSGTSLYVKAIIDYQYRPIFGINVPLSLVESDHEFNLAQRENLLDYNANSIVKDRVLSIFYLNNNLTEESTRDNSPLGEENNARYAIRLSKVLGLFVERYIGEPNNALTRNRIRSEVSNFIENFKTSTPGRMVDYIVICDESNNPPPVVANNELHIRVEVRFAKSLKYIVVFERVLMST